MPDRNNCIEPHQEAAITAPFLGSALREAAHLIDPADPKHQRAIATILDIADRLQEQTYDYDNDDEIYLPPSPTGEDPRI